MALVGLLASATAIGSGLAAHCTARAAAAAEVERRLVAGPGSALFIYDANRGEWRQLAADVPGQPGGDVRLRSGGRPPSGGGASTTGSASQLDTRAIRLRLAGSDDDVRRLSRALDLLVATRYGSAVLADVLQSEDVVLSLSDGIGLRLPFGFVLTTGGTALTKGKQVTISRSRYGMSTPEVLAAMLAHELTHVAQNESSGVPWWQWPWTTVQREETALLVQAVVWAEVKGTQNDWEQDLNLDNATNRGRLRAWIQGNPVYPWWLAPDLAC